MNEINVITTLFEANRNVENSIPMQQYMKNHFPFLGIKTPLRRDLMKRFYLETDILKIDFQPEFVKILWSKEEREYQYAALDYIQRFRKKLVQTHIPFLEELITTKSWWDTVDVISPHFVGKIAKETPSVIEQTIEEWAYGEHLWLCRSAILLQLRYKEDTDEALLYRFILANKDSKEFFIQKAIGWALREYSKTNPNSVRQFINENTLPRLSVREGSKYI
ncbi:DNA alkylation repair protein [Fredinandcohnia humi]